jgi:hypothetical protein
VQRSHWVSQREARSWRGLRSTSPSPWPTCSIPIAVQLSPTVWRQRVRRLTSLKMRPERPTTKCAQTLGSSPSSTSGTSGAKVLYTAPTVAVCAMCSTITRGLRSRHLAAP